MPTAMTRADVCRLLGRVAFGATAADVDEWTGKPYADLVDRLLLVPAAPAGADEATRVVTSDPTSPTVTLSWDGQDARLAWMERMRTTPFPLIERMTLFWHGHFATSIKYPLPPSTAQVVAQVQTLRTLALGNFRTIVEAMTIDPAMLYWLNGNENRIPHPNENYARELFELFTLGKRPQVYTEKDIREAARALTGWTVLPGAGIGATDVPAFQPANHDTGTKKVLGVTIADQGAQEFRAVVNAALAQPVAPLFLAYKLVQDLAYVPATRNLLTAPDPLVKKVAATLQSTDWDVAKAVRTLLLADEFRYANPVKRQQRVRQPVELVVGACKALGINADQYAFLEPLSRMGQQLYAPPNVGGWPVGTGWLSPVTALGRYDAALLARDFAFNLYDPATLAEGVPPRTLPAPDDLAGWATLFGLPGLSAVTTSAITAYLRKKASTADKQAGVVALILSSPDWVVM